MKIFLIGLLVLAGIGFSQTGDKMPAARVHVKLVGGVATKFTSKLTNVVDLNFTMNNGHMPGKAVITAALDRVAKSYGNGTVNAFNVRHIASSLGGSNKGEIPDFSLSDLSAADVIVADNISAFGSPSLGSAKQTAIQTAIETLGKGYLGFHGSGDNTENGWSWYTNSLHPMNYQEHGSRTEGPVYKHLATAKHMILQGILEAGTKPLSVPNEAVGGVEALADNIPTRAMRNEWYRFGRDISTDALYKDKVTILLKYDARLLTDAALPTQFKRKGGNLYTYLYQVGKGVTSYIPAGHENDELMDPLTGFDGGVGDFDRYIAQTMFFQAGYTSKPCDATCNDLPIVDAQNMLTGDKFKGITSVGKIVAINPELTFDPKKMAFTSTYGKQYEAKLTNMSGKVVFSKSGRGRIVYEFDTSKLKQGVYFLSVRIGSSPVKVKRYAVL